MPLEASTYIDGLDASWPLGGDPTNKGDDHLRLIKTIFKNTFPGVGGLGFASAITATEAELNFSSGVTSSIQTQLNNLTTSILSAARESLLPVGSVYTNASLSTNPATLLGFGTWVAFGSGRVLVGFNAADTLFDTLGETGGTKNAVVVSHSHTATSTVSDSGHIHSVNGTSASNYQDDRNGSQSTKLGAATNTSPAFTGVTVATSLSTVGVSGTNANVQPYITVYMWKRTA
jgi:hypothetical protein